MFTESLFYAYVPWSKRALVPHANNIILNYRMKYIYMHYLYIYSAHMYVTQKARYYFFHEIVEKNTK